MISNERQVAISSAMVWQNREVVYGDPDPILFSTKQEKIVASRENIVSPSMTQSHFTPITMDDGYDQLSGKHQFHFFSHYFVCISIFWRGLEEINGNTAHNDYSMTYNLNVHQPLSALHI